MPLTLFMLVDFVDIIMIVDPAVFSHLAVTVHVNFVLDVSEVVFKRIVAVLLLSLPNVAHGQVLLHRHHHVDHLLFQVEVLLLDIGKRPWILDIIGINLPLILAFNSLVVLLIVSNVFVLKFLDDAFEILALVTLNHLVGQSLLRDVTIIEIDTDVLVLHLQIPRDGRVGHDLLEVLLRTIFDLVAVEHGDLGHVLECWLEPASDHHVLLNEFHVCPVVALRQLFFLADGNRVQTFVHASLRFAIERTSWTMKLALIRHLLLYLWKCLGRVVLVLNPESLLAHIVTYFWSQVLLEGGMRLRKFPLL